MQSLSTLFTVFTLISSIQAHSWIACTDYRPSDDSWLYNVSNCFGFPRNAVNFLPKDKPLGTDTGYNSQADPCGQTSRTYTQDFPMATYQKNQKVCLVWPSKNHVANQVNPWIPDGGVVLKAIGPNVAQDPSSSNGFTKVIKDWGISPFGETLMNRGYQFPRDGFQNCPRFDENNDKSMCSQCFTVGDLDPGVWSFVWEWQFNPGQYYRTCFEANVLSGSVPPSSSVASSVVKSTSTVKSTSVKSSTTTQATQPTPKGPFQFVGVNQAGMEFGGSEPWTFSGPTTGGQGSRWTTPSQSSLAFYAQNGFNTIRLPFAWERLQPDLSQGFNQDYLKALKDSVNAITNLGMYAVLDPHNYGRFMGQVLSGSSATAFTNMWVNLLKEFSGNNLVIPGLMNEPHDQDISSWFQLVQSTINSIRNSGFKGRIFVPGVSWTGAHSWITSGNAQKSLSITDPLNLVTFEVHQYLDGDSSGTSSNCVSTSIGVDRLKDITTFMRQNKQTAFLGEFAGSSNSICLQAIDNMMSFMKDNSDVWIGWTWWSAGPWWGGYMYSLEPPVNDKPQYQILTKYIGTGPVTVKTSSVKSTTVRVSSSSKIIASTSSLKTSTVKPTTTSTRSPIRTTSPSQIKDRNVCLDYVNQCLDLHNSCLAKRQNLPSAACDDLAHYCSSLGC